MAHIGFTPQSEHGLGGHIIQGRGEGLEQLLADAHAVEDAGAFAVVLEMVPAAAAAQVTKELHIPTISVGAGPDVDGQLLVWTDWAGLNTGRIPKFVRQYANLNGILTDAGQRLQDGCRERGLPGPRAQLRVTPMIRWRASCLPIEEATHAFNDLGHPRHVSADHRTQRGRAGVPPGGARGARLVGPVVAKHPEYVEPASWSASASRSGRSSSGCRGWTTAARCTSTAASGSSSTARSAPTRAACASTRR